MDIIIAIILSVIAILIYMIYRLIRNTLMLFEGIKDAIVQTNITLESLAPMQTETIKHQERVINKLRAINGSFNNVYNKELTAQMADLASKLRQYEGWDERIQKFALREIDEEY